MRKQRIKVNSVVLGRDMMLRGYNAIDTFVRWLLMLTSWRCGQRLRLPKHDPVPPFVRVSV